MNYLYVTGYTNSFYDDGSTPYTDSGREGFANYCNGVFDLFPENYALKYMELYNEWWGPQFGDLPDKGTQDGNADSLPSTYVQLVEKSYTSVKEKHPEVKLLTDFGPNSIMPYKGRDWNKEIIDLGILDYTDIISTHIYPDWYNDKIPENTLLREQLQELKSRLSEENAADKEIWLTETGYMSFPTDINGAVCDFVTEDSELLKRGVSELKQAQYLPRIYLIALSEGIKRVFWYDLIDEKSLSETSPDRYFGLLRDSDSVMGQYSPKPSYVAYAVMSRMLDNKNFISYENVGAMYHYTFGSGEENIHILFNTDGEQSLTLSAYDNIKVTDLMGKTKEYIPKNGKVVLRIDENVSYIQGSFIVK